MKSWSQPSKWINQRVFCTNSICLSDVFHAKNHLHPWNPHLSGIQESKCFCCTSNHVHPATWACNLLQAERQLPWATFGICKRYKKPCVIWGEPKKGSDKGWWWCNFLHFELKNPRIFKITFCLFFFSFALICKKVHMDCTPFHGPTKIQGNI